jgi:hypothetical protein
MISKKGKSMSANICFPDGRQVWSPYIWLFWMTKSEPYIQLTRWSWPDGVKEDERYKSALEKAKRIADE